MKLKLLLLFSIVLNCFSTKTYSQKLVLLTQKERKIDLSKEMITFFEDSSTTLTFGEIQQKKFNICTQENINTGYSKPKFWYKLNVKNESNKRWTLGIVGTLIDEIELFEVIKDSLINKRISGDHHPHSTREIDSPIFAFHLNIPQNQAQTLYLSIKSEDTKQFTLHIYEEELFSNTLKREMFKWFFYFGMLFMMFAYNLLLYFSIRDIAYLYYVFYIASFGLLQFTIYGYGPQFLWGENIWFTNRATNFFSGGTTIFITLFTYNFLNIKFFYPKLKIAFTYLVVNGVLMLLTIFLKPSSTINYIIALVSLSNILFMIIIGILIFLKGYQPARYYMFAWGILFLSLALFILNVSKILPDNSISYLILPAGGIIEVTMLSFGLGNRINTIQKEKTNAQKEVVKQLQNNEEVRSRIARDLHDDLGSTLSSIRILSEFAENQTQTDPSKVPNLLHRITNSTQKLQENLQDIVWTTQTKDNTIEELFIRIRQFGGEILEAKNINYHLKIDNSLNKIAISPNFQYDIFMIFKESINNIVKYANAENVVVNFNLKDNLIVLSIKDDGVGFDTELEKEGNGLKNMPRRAENIDGKVEISSKIGSGTTIILSMPVPQ